MPTPPKVVDVIEDDNFAAAIALSIGGDGTFLRTAQWVANKNIPILGINTGRLGYLAEVNINEVEEAIADLLSNNYEIEDRIMLEITTDANVKIDHPYALNEVAILRHGSSSMINVKTEVNNKDLTTYLGDGLIVSTPTGSTAYNLSVGGPILEPVCRCIVLSPVSPHSLTMRPLVIKDSSLIKTTTTSREECYQVSLDGRSFTMPSGSSIFIKKSPQPVMVIQREPHDFAEILRTKLMLGADKR